MRGRRNGHRYGGTAAYGRWSEGMSGAPPAGPEQTPGCPTSGTRAARAEDGVPGVPSDPPPTRRRRTAQATGNPHRPKPTGNRPPATGNATAEGPVLAAEREALRDVFPDGIVEEAYALDLTVTLRPSASS
ncbi:hypothetical protein Srufu_033710 [Streptomyces libani subsp. rufus]|nr:hypothetical protein Srufu_033710 [Streptomyces libani subsp. rufus]